MTRYTYSDSDTSSNLDDGGQTGAVFPKKRMAEDKTRLRVSIPVKDRVVRPKQPVAAQSRP